MKKKAANLLSFFAVHNEWLSLAGFILISAVFWLLLKLNKQYAITRKIPVTYVYAGEKLPDSIFTDTLIFKLKGSGWKLLQWEWEHRERVLPFPADIKSGRALQALLESGKEKNPVKDIRLSVNKNRKGLTVRKVPVKLVLQSRETAGKGLDINKLVPAEVLIWGKQDRLKKIKYIPVKKTTWDELTGHSVKEIPLSPPGEVSVFPGKVKLYYHLKAFIRGSTDVIPEIPDSLSGRLVLFPSKVHIEYKRWVDGKPPSGKWKVLAVPVGSGQNLYFRPVIKSKPSSVFDVRMSPEKFDYLITNE